MSTNVGWFWGCSVPSLKWKEARWGGQADVLGCWGDSSSASSGMRGKDEMGCQCFSSAVLRQCIDVWRELSSNTWSGGSIVRELAELGRDLMNNKLFTLRMMVGLPPRPSDAVITYGTLLSCLWNSSLLSGLSYFLQNVKTLESSPSLFWSLPCCCQLIQSVLFLEIVVLILFFDLKPLGEFCNTDSTVRLYRKKNTAVTRTSDWWSSLDIFYSWIALNSENLAWV